MKGDLDASIAFALYPVPVGWMSYRAKQSEQMRLLLLLLLHMHLDPDIVQGIKLD